MRVGHHLGAGAPTTARKVWHLAVGTAVSFSGAIACLFVLLREYIGAAFSHDEAVVRCRLRTCLRRSTLALARPAPPAKQPE